MATHILHLDDSGTKEYSPDSRYGSGNTRYFVFGGMLLTEETERNLAAGVRALKRETFGTDNVEIKSNWLRIERERKTRYLSRFSLTPEKLDGFVDEFYELLIGSPLELIACVVDKVHMKEKYGARAWYPPAAAYEAVLQRAQQTLGDPGSFRVVVDDMTGATPKGNQYRANLRRHHRQLRKTGSGLWRGIRFENLEELIFVDSKKSQLTQVADVVAYNVFRQFRQYGEAWEDKSLKKLPAYDWFRRIAKKFRQGPNGRIQGYGVVKMPLLDRVEWSVKQRK